MCRINARASVVELSKVYSRAYVLYIHIYTYTERERESSECIYMQRTYTRGAHGAGARVLR